MSNTNNPGLTRLDYGNHETMAIGMVREGDAWLCLTLTESARLKTERGAVAWLARRGYRADGSRK